MRNTISFIGVFITISWSNLVITAGVFPLRMPNIRPTTNEAYLCTGVKIGPERRYFNNLIK